MAPSFYLLGEALSPFLPLSIRIPKMCGATLLDRFRRLIACFVLSFADGNGVGHNVHSLWNPQFIELQKRSVQWLLRQI